LGAALKARTPMDAVIARDGSTIADACRGAWRRRLRKAAATLAIRCSNSRLEIPNSRRDSNWNPARVPRFFVGILVDRGGARGAPGMCLRSRAAAQCPVPRQGGSACAPFSRLARSLCSQRRAVAAHSFRAQVGQKGQVQPKPRHQKTLAPPSVSAA
jgi:hypothetical protein